MPTKPTRKHGKDFLDEAVAKSTYQKKALTRRRVMLASVIAFPFGWWGAHNFLMRNKKRGLIHIASSTFAILLFAIPFMHGLTVVFQCKNGGECVDISGYDDTLNVILITGIVLFALNLIWGVVEGVILLWNSQNYPSSKDKK